MTDNPELFVTNFNRNYTGVSSTAAAVYAHQQLRYVSHLVGRDLPGCRPAIARRQAVQLSSKPHDLRPFSIWHVRRNTEMRAAIMARDGLRKPIKIVFTSAAQRRHSAFPRWLISRMDAVIATTKEAAAFVPNVAAVVPHGVDTALFHPAQNRFEAWHGLGFGGMRGIATLGRIRPEKGTDRFVDMALEVLPKHEDTVALVIGAAKPRDKAFERNLKDKVAAHGLSDRILFLGEKSQNEVSAILPALSLLVALPRYEGYGMTPLEAMACGVPVIASDTGYYRSFIGGSAAGVVLDLDESVTARAAQAVDAWLSDDARVEAGGKAAHARAVDAFDVRTEVDEIGAVYAKLWAGVS